MVHQILCTVISLSLGRAFTRNMTEQMVRSLQAFGSCVGEASEGIEGNARQVTRLVIEAILSHTDTLESGK